MTDIIEKMAEAAWDNDCYPDLKWKNLDVVSQQSTVQDMRAALLSLSEAKIDNAMLLAIDAGDRDVEAFRCITRAIAEQPSETPE